MPITVKVLSQENYEAWLSGAIEKFAGLTESNINLELASVD
jgi:heme/copper-type cytochrome/quinol oxidase subunit 2